MLSSHVTGTGAELWQKEQLLNAHNHNSTNNNNDYCWFHLAAYRLFRENDWFHGAKMPINSWSDVKISLRKLLHPSPQKFPSTTVLSPCHMLHRDFDVV